MEESPYGYVKYGDETIEEPSEQKILNLIRVGLFKIYKTTQEIARFLNERNYRTRRGTKWTARTVESTWEAHATRESGCV